MKIEIPPCPKCSSSSSVRGNVGFYEGVPEQYNCHCEFCNHSYYRLYDTPKEPEQESQPEPPVAKEPFRPYWVIFFDGRPMPQEFKSEATARFETLRCAGEHPGKTYVVLEAIADCMVPIQEPQWRGRPG